MTVRPELDIAGAKRAHAALITTMSKITDEHAARPSRLPGWTVGHVIAHLARNADSHTRMFAGAAQGEVWDQYPGGPQQRVDDIEAGAPRPAAELASDATAALRRLETAWDNATDTVWESGRGRIFAGELDIAVLPFRRWREVEMHHADLGLDFTWRDWPADYTTLELERAVAGLGARLIDGPLALRSTDSPDVWTVPDNACTVIEIRAPRRQLLAWLFGRFEDPNYPTIKPW
jgi:maleylpyruvate isomerase